MCAEGETVAFSCGVGSKSLSVCGLADDTLSYRFGTPERVELEITAPIHFSRTAYSGGGEGNLTFAAGRYKYVVYSSISNGDWLADGGRDKIERAGVYVVKDDKLLAAKATQQSTSFASCRRMRRRRSSTTGNL